MTTETKEAVSKALDELLDRVTRYDARIDGGCECCGDWIEYDEYNQGDLVKYDDIEALVKSIKDAL